MVLRELDRCGWYQVEIDDDDGLSTSSSDVDNPQDLLRLAGVGPRGTNS
jgi:hypothetical protein